MAKDVKISRGETQDVPARKAKFLSGIIGFVDFSTGSDDPSTKKKSAKKSNAPETGDASRQSLEEQTAQTEFYDPSVSSIDSMLDYARKYLGSPYLSPSKVQELGEKKAIQLAKSSSSSGLEPIDCSGFAQKVLAAAGLDPAGDQTAQGLFDYFKKNGTELKSPQKGAMIFFEPLKKEPADTGKWNSGRMITHVGFSAGGNKILDSSSNGKGVQERPLPSDGRFKYHYIMPKYKFGSGVS